MPLLEVHGLTKMFGGLPAVRNLYLTLEEGEIAGLIGPNGAGKTTTFNTITGFERPTAGRVVFQGEDITGLPPDQITLRGLVRTFQIPQPFGMFTTLDNVMVAAFLKHPTRREAERKAWRVLERVGMVNRAHFLARNLTLAEAKRLEIARALATDPRVILLDEAMAGLTPVEADSAVELILSLNRDEKITFLVIEHVMQIVMAICRRIMVLDYGEKIAEGSPDEVVNDARVIEAYLGEDLTLA